MRYALINTDTLEIIRYQNFDEPPSALAPEKGLAWREEPLPEFTVSLSDYKTSKIEQVKERRDFLTLNGGHKIGEHWFHSNELSLIQQMALTGLANQMAAAGAPDSTVLIPVPWKTLGTASVPLTVGLAKAFVGSALNQQAMLFGAATAKIAAITAMTTIADVEAYSIIAGFPATYTEEA